MFAERPELFHELIEWNARRTPERAAIRDRNGEWTYRELSDASIRLSQRLAETGLRRGDRVLVDLEPTREGVATLFACSRLGFVFVPVSPDTPTERVAQIAQLAGVALTVHRDERRGVTEFGVPHFLLENVKLRPSSVEATAGSDTLENVVGTDLAYIVFTSGTTGTPKGIAMTHGAMMAFFRGMVQRCQLDAEARVGTISPLSFDLSLLDMGLAFGSCATLVQVPRNLVHQPRRFMEFLCETRVTQMNGVPSIWRMVLPHAAEMLPQTELECVVLAGEACQMADVRTLRSKLPRLHIINVFGQSESIACSFWDVPIPLDDDATELSVGHPHQGVEWFLLDEEGREIIGPGTGELYMKGPTLFSGYWNDQEATDRALVPDPRCRDTNTIVLKTGDVLERDSAGNFAFRGRVDLQVQILGNRVELEEIERCLGGHPDVARAVVRLDPDDSSRLVALVEPSPTAGADRCTTEELRAHCSRQMPAYMVPKQMTWVDAIPLTGHGKLHRAAVKAELSAPPEVIRRSEHLSALDESRLIGPPRRIVSAQGTTLIIQDPDGTTREVLDFMSAYGAVNFGHNNPAICLRSDAPVDLAACYYPPEVDYVSDWLVSRLELPTHKVLFQVGGSFAVSTALALAQRARPGKVLSIEGAFHGLGWDTMSASTVHVESAVQRTRLTADSARHFEALRPGKLPDSWDGVSCVLFEAIQGANGYVPLDPAWLRALEREARASGALVVSDEIQCGFYRHGALSPSRAAGLTPDLLLFSKSLTNGLYPMSAVVYSGALDGAYPGTVALAHTFQTSAHGIYAMKSVMDFIDNHPVGDEGRRIESHLQTWTTRLEELGAKSTCVTGPTLSFALQPNGAARQLVRRCLEQGAMFFCGGAEGQRVRVAPPLLTTNQQLDQGRDVLMGCLSDQNIH